MTVGGKVPRRTIVGDGPNGGPNSLLLLLLLSLNVPVGVPIGTAINSRCPSRRVDKALNYSKRREFFCDNIAIDLAIRRFIAELTIKTKNPRPLKLARVTALTSSHVLSDFSTTVVG